MTIDETSFPALYRSADALSLASQVAFFRALAVHLGLLVFAALLSITTFHHWSVAALQLLVLLAALGCSVFLFSKRPDRYWYAARAVAESIKTSTWRFVCRAEPFDGPDAQARSVFQLKLKQIVEQNRDVAQSLTEFLDARQITVQMLAARALSLDARKSLYAESRIHDQLTWYAKKAAFNRRTSAAFFWGLIAVNAIAVVLASLRIGFPSVSYWPTDVFVAAAASLLSWMQAKRFSELAASYALAAHEIGFVREQALEASTESAFSAFVGDAENAFSREHTQWVARKDV